VDEGKPLRTGYRQLRQGRRCYCTAPRPHLSIQGRVLQVNPIKHTLKAPETKHFTLKHYKLPSILLQFGFQIQLAALHLGCVQGLREMGGNVQEETPWTPHHGGGCGAGVRRLRQGRRPSCNARLLSIQGRGLVQARREMDGAVQVKVPWIPRNGGMVRRIMLATS